MDRRLKHLPRVKARVDDIAIGGLDEADHSNMLYQVCEVLKKARLTVRSMGKMSIISGRNKNFVGMCCLPRVSGRCYQI